MGRQWLYCLKDREARTSTAHETMATVLKPQSKTSLVKRFIFDAGSSIVSVEFRKTDGSLRKLQFNPRDTTEVKGTGYALKSPSIVRCRDFTIARTEGQGAWRSFDCERVVSIKANGIALYC
jgi:uncharacterized protein YfaP (DUF2135 family)